MSRLSTTTECYLPKQKFMKGTPSGLAMVRTCGPASQRPKRLLIQAGPYDARLRKDLLLANAFAIPL